MLEHAAGMPTAHGPTGGRKLFIFTGTKRCCLPRSKALLLLLCRFCATPCCHSSLLPVTDAAAPDAIIAIPAQPRAPLDGKVQPLLQWCTVELPTHIILYWNSPACARAARNLHATNIPLLVYVFSVNFQNSEFRICIPLYMCIFCQFSETCIRNMHQKNSKLQS